MKIFPILTALAMLIPAITMIIYWKKKYHLSYYFFLWGAVSFIIMLPLKMIASKLLHPICIPFFESLPIPLSIILKSIYIGLYTGVFESGIVLIIGLLILKIRNSNWEQAIAYGIGDGATEAIVLGTINLLVGVAFLFVPLDTLEIIAPKKGLETFMSGEQFYFGFLNELLQPSFIYMLRFLCLPFLLRKNGNGSGYLFGITHLLIPLPQYFLYLIKKLFQQNHIYFFY